MGWLDSLSGGNAAKSSKNAIKENIGALDGLLKGGYDIIDSGQNDANAALDRGIGFYQPYQQTGTAANDLYADALGLNGADGNGRASAAFTTSPGYEFTRSQGEQAALRGASAGGMLASGNTITALADYTSGLASKEQGSWLDRLAGVASNGLSAASGAAGLTGAHAQNFQGAADDRLSLLSSVVAGKNDLNSQRATLTDTERANKNGFFGGLLKGGISLGTKAATGGLF